jgi:phosphoglycolate phosphatase
VPLVKTLIFDFDGTLADSFGLAMDLSYEILGIPPLPAKEVARLRRLPLLKAVRELKVPLYRLPRLLLHGRQKMHERIHEVHPFPGIPEVLAILHEQGNHMLVISSNSEQNVRSFLRANELEHYFDGVYGSVGVFDKAGALRKVMRRNKLDAANCYYIGDEVRDVMAASRVRIHPVSVAWGYQHATALKEHQPFAIAYLPTDLLEIFAADKV